MRRARPEMRLSVYGLPCSRDFPAPDKLAGVRNVDLDSARLANDAPEEFVDCAIVEWAGVDVLQAREDVALAVGIAKGQVFGLLQSADLQGEAGSHVEKLQQLGVNLVDLAAPVLDVHSDCSVVINKKTSRDFFRIAAGSFEGV